VTRISRLLQATILATLLTASLPSAHAARIATAAQNAAGQDSTPTQQAPEGKQEEKDEDDAYLHSAAVQSLGKLVGLNPEQAATTFTVLNFIVLAALVGLVLAKTLPKTFRNRNTAIQKHLVDARTATEEASARLNSVEERLAKLDGQIEAMRTQAEKDVAHEEQRIKASVEDEKKKILAAAEQEIHSATAIARREIQKYAAELAIEQAARKLTISAETDRLLVENFASRLGQSGSEGGHN
jgi:F-type H+-transporting ATPase subunit b